MWRRRPVNELQRSRAAASLTSLATKRLSWIISPGRQPLSDQLRARMAAKMNQILILTLVIRRRVV